jgi:hypothetical protein
MSYATITSGIRGSADELRKKMNNVFQGFESPHAVSATKEFLQSNSLVAKLAFLVLVIMAFVILMRLGVQALVYFFTPKNTPFLVSGIKDAKKLVVVPQDPAAKHSIPVKRSVDQDTGAEFTYSTWIYIDDLEYLRGQYKHIFHKGNDKIEFDGDRIGMNFPNNAPGLYIHPNKNALVVVMNTFKNIDERVEIDSIPLNKWINVLVRLEGRNLDVYVNGNIAKRHELSDVPKQNYGDVYVNMNGGFSGLVSDLRYFNYGLSPAEIMNVSSKGPNMKTDKSMNVFPPYFSLRWYFSKSQ